MNKFSLFVCYLLVSTAVVLTIAPPVTASTNCALPVSGRCQGWAQVSTKTGGVVGTDERCFSWKTVNSTPACATTTSNLSWELDPGNCITLYYFDTSNGATAPAVPNKVTLRVMFDATSTTIKTFLSSGTEPANGAPFSFCATSDGNSGSAQRAGTYDARMDIVKDDGPAGVGNYNLQTQTCTASVGAISTCDGGALRATLFISSVVRSAYPADSTFSYGATTNEQITVTLTMTQPNGDANVETMSDAIADSATMLIGVVGATTDVDATTLAQSFTVDTTSFPFANNPYVPIALIRGSSVFTGTSWTNMAATGHGAGITRDSGIQVHDGSFNIDARIVADSTGTNTFATADNMFLERLNSNVGTIVSVFNRGETSYGEGYFLNSRSEKLSRNLTLTIADTGNVNACISLGSITPVANLYSYTATVPTGGTCAAANTAAGTDRFIRATATNEFYLSNVTYDVSSLYYIDAHIQNTSTLVKDNFPTENANETTAYFISNALTDTTYGWCHVVSVRKDVDIDTSAGEITRSYIDPLSVNRFTQNTETAGDGWTATSLNLLASTPLGIWTFQCLASHNGNNGTDNQLFNVSVPGTTGGGFPGDPIRVFCNPVMAFTGQAVRCVITETLIDGTGRTGNAASTDVNIRDASNSLVVNAQQPTEWQYGSYYYDYTPVTTGYFSVQIKTIDVTTNGTIPGTNGFYVQEGWASISQAQNIHTTVNATNVLATNINTTVNNINTTVNTISGIVTSINGTVISVNGTVTSMNTTVNGLTTVLNAVNGTVTSINGTITSVNGTVISINGTVVAMFPVLNETEQHTDDINDTVNNLTLSAGNSTSLEGQILQNLTDHRNNTLEIFSMQNVSALVMLTLFVLAIAMAEWKKDMMYHLLAVIIGIYGIVTMSTDLGVSVVVILGIMVYQILRIFRIYRTPRNDMQRPETDTNL